MGFYVGFSVLKNNNNIYLIILLIIQNSCNNSHSNSINQEIKKDICKSILNHFHYYNHDLLDLKDTIVNLPTHVYREDLYYFNQPISKIDTPFYKIINDIKSFDTLYNEKFKYGFSIILSNKIYLFTQPLFDESKKYAIVFSQIKCRGECGEGDFFIVELQNKTWKIIYYYNIYVS